MDGGACTGGDSYPGLEGFQPSFLMVQVMMVEHVMHMQGVPCLSAQGRNASRPHMPADVHSPAQCTCRRASGANECTHFAVL